MRPRGPPAPPERRRPPRGRHGGGSGPLRRVALHAHVAAAPGARPPAAAPCGACLWRPPETGVRHSAVSAHHTPGERPERPVAVRTLVIQAPFQIQRRSSYYRRPYDEIIAQGAGALRRNSTHLSGSCIMAELLKRRLYQRCACGSIINYTCIKHKPRV